MYKNAKAFTASKRSTIVDSTEESAWWIRFVWEAKEGMAGAKFTITRNVC